MPIMIVISIAAVITAPPNLEYLVTKYDRSAAPRMIAAPVQNCSVVTSVAFKKNPTLNVVQFFSLDNNH